MLLILSTCIFSALISSIIQNNFPCVFRLLLDTGLSTVIKFITATSMLRSALCAYSAPVFFKELFLVYNTEFVGGSCNYMDEYFSKNET